MPHLDVTLCLEAAGFEKGKSSVAGAPKQQCEGLRTSQSTLGELWDVTRKRIRSALLGGVLKPDGLRCSHLLLFLKTMGIKKGIPYSFPVWCPWFPFKAPFLKANGEASYEMHMCPVNSCSKGEARIPLFGRLSVSHLSALQGTICINKKSPN